MSEPSPSGGGKGYGACPDEIDVGDDGKVSDFTLVSHRKNLRRQIHRGPIADGARRMARIIKSKWGPHKIDPQILWGEEGRRNE